MSSRKHDGRWVLPKGGIEKTDDDVRAAAVRELWEEAGIKVDAEPVPSRAGSSSYRKVNDHKPHKKCPVKDPSNPAFVPRAIYTAVEVLIRNEEEDLAAHWPEQGERERCFVPLKEALQRIEWRKDIHQLLSSSSLSS